MYRDRLLLLCWIERHFLFLLQTILLLDNARADSPVYGPAALVGTGEAVELANHQKTAVSS